MSERQITRLIDRGVTPQPKGKGGYDLKACNHGYIRYLRASKTGQGSDGEAIDLLDEKARLTREQADQVALKNAHMRGELAPIELVGWTISKACAQMAAILETIPAKLKRAMPSLGAAEMEIIKKEIVKVQNLAADAEIDFDEYRDGDDSAAASGGEARQEPDS